MPIRTEQEIDHAIRRMTLVRDGLRLQKLEAHATIADYIVEALKWSRGGESKMTEIIDNLDSGIASALAHTN